MTSSGDIISCVVPSRAGGSSVVEAMHEARGAERFAALACARAGAASNWLS
jgi:hypothetical protein